LVINDCDLPAVERTLKVSGSTARRRFLIFFKKFHFGISHLTVWVNVVAGLGMSIEDSCGNVSEGRNFYIPCPVLMDRYSVIRDVNVHQSEFRSGLQKNEYKEEWNAPSPDSFPHSI